MTQPLTVFTLVSPAQALEFGIRAWIHEKFGYINSEKTRTASTETITRYQHQFIDKLTALLGVSGMMAKLFATGIGE